MAQTIEISGPVYPGRVLQTGSSGSEVARMQTYLNALQKAGYPTLKTLTVDGQYGAVTANTVKQFQALKGLSIDGKIGPPPGTPSWRLTTPPTTAAPTPGPASRCAPVPPGRTCATCRCG